MHSLSTFDIGIDGLDFDAHLKQLTELSIMWRLSRPVVTVPIGFYETSLMKSHDAYRGFPLLINEFTCIGREGGYGPLELVFLANTPQGVRLILLSLIRK